MIKSIKLSKKGEDINIWKYHMVRSASSCPFRIELNILADHIINSVLHIRAHPSLHVPLVQDKLNYS